MSALAGTSCLEILSCLREDHEACRSRLRALATASSAEDKRRLLDEFAPFHELRVQAEEETFLARALEIEGTRATAMACFEAREMVGIALARVRQSAQEEQLTARLRVLSDLADHHLELTEQELFPRIRAVLNVREREEMGVRYREAKDRNELAPTLQMPSAEPKMESEAGRIGYIVAWLLGVPAWVLLLIFMVRGH